MRASPGLLDLLREGNASLTLTQRVEALRSENGALTSENEALEQAKRSVEYNHTLLELRLESHNATLDKIVEYTENVVENNNPPAAAEEKLRGIQILVKEYRNYRKRLVLVSMAQLREQEWERERERQIKAGAGPSAGVAEQGQGPGGETGRFEVPLSELPSTSEKKSIIEGITPQKSGPFIASPFEETLFSPNIRIWVTEVFEIGALPPGLTLGLSLIFKLVKMRATLFLGVTFVILAIKRNWKSKAAGAGREAYNMPYS